MTDDKQVGQEGAPPADSTPDVEGHGAKEVVGIGLAAAALIGGGAAAVKYAGDDERDRRPAELVVREGAPLDVKAADRDEDGYLTYQELSEASGKWSVEALNAEGVEVTPEALASAGYKVELNKFGDEGFAVEGDTIFLKLKVDEELDSIAQGPALEWVKKHQEIDTDRDGYADVDDLTKAGYEVKVDMLKEEGYEVTTQELVSAGIKFPLATLGEDGFITQPDAVMLKEGVYDKLDSFLNKEG